jgi:hypothetical protein
MRLHPTRKPAEAISRRVILCDLKTGGVDAKKRHVRFAGNALYLASRKSHPSDWPPTYQKWPLIDSAARPKT